MKNSCVLLALLLCFSANTPAERQFYDVKKNDTLWSISREFGVSIDELKDANQINDELNLTVGMRLLIPFIYNVEKGDTLWSIAQKHHTSVQVLRELNELAGDGIKVGDILLVPEDAGTTEVDTTAPVSSMAEAPFWPHGGIRSSRAGKLSGTEFLGSQGDDIITIASGEVVWNSLYRGYGNVIIIESAGNYLYLYTGLAAIHVDYGERVRAGATIAELGVDPHTGEAKLLLSVYKNGKLVDPSLAPRG